MNQLKKKTIKGMVKSLIFNEYELVCKAYIQCLETTKNKKSLDRTFIEKIIEISK